MVPPVIYISITVAILFPVHVAAYANGSVVAACSDMVPQHGVSAQTSSAPYTLTVSNTSFMGGDKITVTLRNTSAYPIEGFLIQARQGNSNTPLGSFQISGTDVQTLTCTTAASAVSHTSDSEKSVVQVTWIAPQSQLSNVQMRATVVRNGTIFWTNVLSSTLTYAAASHILASTPIICMSIMLTLLLSLRS